MYSCIGAGICQMNDIGEFIVTNKADFAGIWLQRIKPDQLNKDTNTEKSIEHS